ncbi:MAG: hypothetical protein RL186_1878 [Pseudomonadota bacterium]|jgi:hypothetical protein
MSQETNALRRQILLACLGASFGGPAMAQSTSKMLEDLARAALAKAAGGKTAAGASVGATASIPANLTLGEADGGLREALSSAALTTALKLGKLDGYWADGKVRIPLPRPLDSLQSRLKPLKLSLPLDNFQMRLNRAAETAAPKAGSIFVNTIKSLTLTDALDIVRGGPTAGTDMLKARAGVEVTRLLTPPMTEAVDASGAGAALDRINARYGSEITRMGGLNSLSSFGIPDVKVAPSASAQAQAAAGPLIFGAPTNPSKATPAPTATSQTSGSLKTQLVGFAVTKALDGLFLYIGEEERAIRQDPAKRTTDLLKRVFGGL